MIKKKFALIGTGFWSAYQLAGWHEVEGAECIALCNRTLSKAQRLGERFGIKSIYADPKEMLEKEGLDFVDIAADISVHEELTLLALERGIPVICQKPFAPDIPAAERMLAASEKAGVPLLINENWRWQRPVRALKAAVAKTIGDRPWRARIIYNSSFPVFENQPFLKELDEFILMDVGTHILDTARYLFGEIETLYGRTHQVQPDIKGEDAATLLLTTDKGTTVSVEMSYASRWSEEAFPQTYCYVEGANGSVELRKDFRILTTTEKGTEETTHAPVNYPWMDKAYGVIHSSIVDCQKNLLEGIVDPSKGETTGRDNLKTFRAVRAAYRSAREGVIINKPG